MGREPLIVEVPRVLPRIIAQVRRDAWADLTGPQRLFLGGANDCTPPAERAVRFGWSGIAARAANVRVAKRLLALGFVEYVSHGRCEDDGNGDAERPIYAITTRGREILAAGQTPSAPSVKR